MATRSCIGEVLPDGRVRAIYCHGDGGLHRGSVGWTLATFYASAERVASLVNLGDCSRLQPGLGQWHKFGQAPANWSTFYGRDRGEQGKEFRVYRNVEQFVRKRAGYGDVEFLYLWGLDGEGWSVRDVFAVVGMDGIGDWMPLAEALANAE